MYNQVVGSSAERIEARDRIICWKLFFSEDYEETI